MADDDKKLQYLKRDEVKTMEKDIARLREQEAEAVREKIAQTRTAEEIKKEAEKQERIKKTIGEREKIEAEAERKKEELSKLKTKRAASAAFEAAETAGKEEKEKETLKARLKETQMKEEEERRRFLERVAEKAGEKPAESYQSPPRPAPSMPPRQTEDVARPIPSPLPEKPVPPKPPSPPMPPPADLPSKPPAPIVAPAPTVPAKPKAPPEKPLSIPMVPPLSLPKKRFRFPSFKIPSIKIPPIIKIGLPKKPKTLGIKPPKIRLPRAPKVAGYFPKKPSIFGKLWVRIAASIFIILILATIITFWYWYLAVRPGTGAPSAPAPATPATVTAIPEEEPEITQKMLGAGYHLPATPRIIDTIIIHSGFNISNGNPYDMEGIIRSYKEAVVATHYLIDRGGAIFQLAPDYAIAYHAGAGKTPDGRIGVNNFSIGISMVYQETEGPNESQYQSLSWLVKNLKKKYNVPSENILGYKNIDTAKNTPWNFDWEKFKLLISLAAPSPNNNGAEFILERLTLEEKIGQLFVVGFNGTKLTPELENFIKTVRPGGIVLFEKNIKTAPQVKELIRNIQKISLAETGLPLFVAIDQEGGAVSRAGFIKEKTGQSEIENADQAYKIGLERGGELKDLGINLNLAPVLDPTQSGDFLYKRSFQKKPDEAGILARALVLGQKAAGVLTSLKHFPGYGGISFNPEEKLAALAGVPQVDYFREAMRANPEIVMAANAVYSNIDAEMPITFSKKGVAFIKRELGEAPLIITDDLIQNSLLQNFSLNGVATLPVKAGIDMLLLSGPDAEIEYAILAVKNGVQLNYISEETVNEAVLRIIVLKQGFFGS